MVLLLTHTPKIKLKTCTTVFITRLSSSVHYFGNMKKPTRKDRLKKTKKVSKTSWNPNKDFVDNENKQYLNSMFTVMIMSLIHRIRDFTFENSFVGAFDGVERNTARTLISMGFQKSAILLNESNEVVAKCHVQAGFPVHEGVNFGDSRFDDVYQQENQAWRVYTCLGWYFDTCGEIRKQQPSLLSTLRKLKLVDGSVLAFTFSRNRMKIQEYVKQKRRFIQKVDRILGVVGMELRVEMDHDYAGRSMFHRARESHMNSFVGSVKLIGVQN